MPTRTAASVLVALAVAAPPARAAQPLEAGDRTLAEWIAAMRDSMAEPSDRWRAGVRVRSILEKAGPDHPEVRAALPELVMALEDAGVNPEGAKGAAEALEVLGPAAADAVPTLLDVLGHEVYDDPQASQVQAAAATTLAAIGVASPEVVETLLARAEDGLSYATEPVLLALGRLAPAETSRPVLIAALERGTSFTQGAGRALAEMGAEAAPAREALERAIGPSADEEGWLEWLGGLLPFWKTPRDLPESSGPAAALLVAGGTDRGLAHLDYQLRELPAYYDRRVVVASLWYARSAGFATLLPLFQRALTDPSEVVRRDTLLLLQRFGPEAAPIFPALVQAFADPDEFARVGALDASWGVTGGDPERLLPHYVKCLADPGYRVRARAATLIGRMGRAAASAAPALERMADDPETYPRRAAARALRRVR